MSNLVKFGSIFIALAITFAANNNFKVVEEDGGGFMSTGVLVGAVARAVIVALVLALQRRRRTAEEMKLIDSWGVFGDGLVDEENPEEESSEDEKLDWDNV